MEELVEKEVCVCVCVCVCLSLCLCVCHVPSPKSSYKKCRFTAFLCCLKTAAVLGNRKKNTLLLPFYPRRQTRMKKYQAHSYSSRLHILAWERG